MSVAESFGRETLYLDLERPSDRAKLSDSEYFLSQHLDKLVILDEIQRFPEILPVLRSLIDQRRRTHDNFGQYLLLGSSSKSLLSHTSESLAGRIHYIDMQGFNLLEVNHLNDLWLRGGFPQSYLSKNTSFSWRENIIRTYLEREIPMLGYKVSTQTLRRFWGMLAHNQGELFNGSKIAASLGVSTPTVFRYLDILSDLFLVRTLQPWHQNEGKRLVKSPKIYIRDSGLLHSLLNLKMLDDVLMHPVAGSSFEGFVIENIASKMNQSKMWFYRTSAGAEMDLVLEHGQKRIGIEIKRSLSPSPSKGLYNSMNDLKLEEVYIVYPGDTEYKITDQITVIPLVNILKKLLFF